MTAKQPTPGIRPSTDDLIASLTADVPPVPRIWPAGRRLAAWTGGLALILSIAALAIGVRADLPVRLGDASFVAQLLALLAVAVASAALALRSSVPGEEPPLRLSAIVILLATAGLALACGREPAAAAHDSDFVAAGWPCAAVTVLIATLPLVLLAGLVRRAAPLVPTVAGLLAGGAAFFAAVVALQLVCPHDERWHLLVWHLGPVALGLLASAALGASWLARWRRVA
ncbi:MAG: DUF1109 domain-containing protein [Deltaproteobacteria bacterium]|nr:DUF1109 domain-containing protein [Deltaproteobacteria bacterium]